MIPRSASCLVAVTFVLAFLVLPLHPQEGGGGDEASLEDLLKSVEDLQRKIDRESVEAEKTGAYLGSLEPWPHPDPDLVFPIWSESVRNAERLTAAEVLQRSETVKLAVLRNPAVASLYDGAREMLGDAVEAVVATGRHTNPDSAAELELTVLLSSTSFNFSRGGNSTGSEGLHFLQTVVRLSLPARVLRGGEVHHVPLVVADTIHTRMWPGAPGRDDLALAMRDAVRKLFVKLPGLTAKAPAGPGVWGPWIGDMAQSNRRFDEWNAAFRASARQLDPALDAVPGFRAVRPWDERYRSAWTRALGAAGFVLGLEGEPDLLGEMFFDRYDGGRRLNGGGVVTGRTSVLERDAVAVLDGRYVRVAGASFVDVTYPRFASASDVGEKTESIQELAIQEFVAELGTGGDRAGQVRHQDAELVAKFLRTRQRTPLPAEVVDDVSNKIALALAGATDLPAEWLARWKQAPDGAPMFHLPSVGDARSAELVPRRVQAAVRRVLDDLTLADPLGLYAFDQPFDFDRSGGYQDELPEGFVELLTDRPSGAGALQRVYVDTADSAAWDLAADYGQQARYKLVQASLRSAFTGQRILVCEYIPEDGDVNWSTSRYFWYGAEPEGWAELARSLPAELELDRIGPALALPPKYVAEADALIAR